MKRKAMIALYVVAALAASAWPLLLHGCGGALGNQAPNAIRATFGGLYGACQTVESDNATWRRICDGVERSMPALNQLGAGPAELPPDVAAREVVITFGDEQ